MQSASLRLSRALAPAQAKRPLFTRILARFAALRSRRALAALEPHQLADIGLSRAEAEQEAARPIWDVPQHWTR